MAEGKELAVCVGLTKLSTEDMYVNFIVIKIHIDNYSLKYTVQQSTKE